MGESCLFFGFLPKLFRDKYAIYAKQIIKDFNLLFSPANTFVWHGRRVGELPVLSLFEAIIRDAELFVTHGISLIASNNVFILFLHCEIWLDEDSDPGLLDVTVDNLLNLLRLNERGR